MTVADGGQPQQAVFADGVIMRKTTPSGALVEVQAMAGDDVEQVVSVKTR